MKPRRPSCLLKIQADVYKDDVWKLSMGGYIYTVESIADVVSEIVEYFTHYPTMQKSILAYSHNLQIEVNYSWLEVVRLLILNIADKDIIAASENDVDFELVVAAS